VGDDLHSHFRGGSAASVWQLFFHDPNGARVGIDFAATESTDAQL
jgi:hypothetical protein